MPALSPVARRRLAIGGLAFGGTLLILLIAALLVLSFGWSWLRHPLERQLAARLHRPVTIGSLRRIDHGFADATLAIDDVRIGQPAWVGGRAFVRIGHAAVTLPILPLLHGSVRPRTVAIDGLAVRLVRRDADHANWKGLSGGGGGGKNDDDGLQTLIVRNGTLVFDDYKRSHFFRASIAISPAGLEVAGGGTLVGRPTRLRLTGPAPVGAGRWPFRLDYRSPIANATLAGVADRPLDLGHFDARAHAWGDDLKHLDLLVEAGLPGTAPAVLDATIRHDRAAWAIRRFAAVIGRSRAAGSLTIDKVDGRTRLGGGVVSTGLDFDDLANAEGRARAAAKKAAAPGRRLPATKIDLSHLARTDGRVTVDIRRLLFRKPSAFRSMAGTLTLDHGTLVAAPFTVGLASGTLGGTVTVRQRGPATDLALDLRLKGGRVERLATDANAFSGALDGRFVLAGPGQTLRAALGAASGRFALVARNGTAGRKVALLLGQDIGRGAFARADEAVRLRCAIAAFAVHSGQGTPDPLLIDTSVAQAQGRGRIDLTDERIDLALTGAPKQKSALRLSGPIRVTGELFSPSVSAPRATSAKGILASLKRAVGGGDALPLAGDADCARLAARALR